MKHKKSTGKYREIMAQKLAQESINSINDHWERVDRWRNLPWFKKIFKKRDFSICYDMDHKRI